MTSTRYILVFKTAYSQILSEIEKLPVHNNAKNETAAFLATVLNMFIIDHENRNELFDKLMKEVVLMIGENNAEWLNNRIYFYSDICSEKIEVRGDCLLMNVPSDCKTNLLVRMTVAFGDMIYNKSCQNNYENAPLCIAGIDVFPLYAEAILKNIPVILSNTFKAIDASKQPSQSDTDDQSNDSSSEIKMFLPFCFIILMFAVALCFGKCHSQQYSSPNSYQTSQSTSQTSESTSQTSESSLKPVNEPLTGTILEGYEQHNTSSITVVAPENKSCVVTLKNISQKTIIRFYVRAKETATIGVPCEILYASFAMGTTWQDVNRLFGDDTLYQKDIGGRNFTNHSYKYTAHTDKAPSVVALDKNSKKPTQSTQTTTSAQPTLTPVSQPISGSILEGYERHNASEITVTASYSEACVVKLKDLWGDTVLSFYVRAGQTETVGVPAQRLYVYFASGKTWYGKENLFGASTSYSKDDGSLDFENYTWSYTLYPVTDGNFTETPIDAEEFFD